MNSLLHALEMQRWDDHRYYHHSRINQSLHLLSAIAFLASYALLFTDPVAAALIGWLVAMVSRQVGHFFFEPKGYDEINRATHAYKEAVKVGYNLRRKVVLMAIWAASPFLLVVDPTLGGVFEPHRDVETFVRDVALIWLAIGFGGLAFRVGQLVVRKGATTAAAWVLKIVTDPFHDIKLYYRAPFQLLRGELMEPASRARSD